MKYKNKSVEKAIQLIDLFQKDEVHLSLTEIAEKLEADPGSLYPILHTLQKHNYLEKDENKKYSLGLRFLEKSHIILSNKDLRLIAKPFLKELANQFGVNTHLAVLRNGQIMYLEREEGYKNVSIQDIVGYKVPAHATALGKVMLAFLPEESLDKFLEEHELEPLTDNTIVDSSELKKELNKIRKNNFALDKEEFERGVTCVATPIRGHGNEVKAAISISLHDTDISEDFFNHVKSEILDCGRKISKEFGCACEEVKQYDVRMD